MPVNVVTEPTETQLARLPQWAKYLIGRQRQIIDELNAERDQLRRQVARDPKGSDTFVDDYGVHPDQPLGCQPRIRFGFDRHALVARLLDDGSVEVASSWGGLVVIPQAGNVIFVRQPR